MNRAVNGPFVQGAEADGCEGERGVPLCAVGDQIRGGFVTSAPAAAEGLEGGGCSECLQLWLCAVLNRARKSKDHRMDKVGIRQATSSLSISPNSAFLLLLPCSIPGSCLGEGLKAAPHPWMLSSLPRGAKLGWTSCRSILEIGRCGDFPSESEGGETTGKF